MLTTSVVDDTFFILQKCGTRALATGNLQCVCAILGHLNTLLASHLRAALEHKWKVTPRSALRGCMRTQPSSLHAVCLPGILLQHPRVRGYKLCPQMILEPLMLCECTAGAQGVAGSTPQHWPLAAAKCKAQHSSGRVHGLS